MVLKPLNVRVELCDFNCDDDDDDTCRPLETELKLLLKNKLGTKPFLPFSNKFIKVEHGRFGIHATDGQTMEYFQMSYSNECILVIGSKPQKDSATTIYVLDMYSKRLLQSIVLNFYCCILQVESIPSKMGGDNLIMTNHERIYSYNLRDFLTTQTNHKPKILWKARVPRILTPQFRGIRGMAIQYSTTDYGEKIQNVLYASDFSRSKVYVFSCVDGRLLKEITHPVIHSPWGMDFNSRGELLLSDFRANKIYMLKCTLDQVQLLKSFGDNELQIPRQVIVDRVTQNIIVYSQENRIICVYDRNGNYLTSSDARVQLSLLQDIMLFNHFTGELLIMDRLFLNTDVLV